MTLHLSTLYAAAGRARLAQWPAYLDAALRAVPPGVDVVLTGHGPIWLYLKLAHALHYESPVAGTVEIFNHNPFEPPEEDPP
jgi:hypothetical protein